MKTMKRTTLWFLGTLAALLLCLTAAAGATIPVASFTASNTNGSAPLTVQFFDTSANSPTSWAWSFGDIGTATTQNPSHTYTTTGTYTVTLTATNGAGSNTISLPGYIVVSKVATMPTANFGSSVTSGNVPLVVQFYDSSTNSPTSWAWSFGDGGTATTQNPSHTYTTTGTFAVTLTATNSAGSNTISKPAYLTVSAASVLPTVSFTATKTSGQIPLSVQFIDSSTNSPTAWVWLFGDGYTSLQQNPLHTYSSVGTYTVTLTASNGAGSSTVTQSGYITTTPAPPISSFTSNVTSGTVPLYIQFNDTSANAPGSWLWFFGDGGTSTVQNPVYEYTTPGSYTVILTATNSAGSNTTDIAKYITASAITMPVTSFKSDVTTGIAPLTVQFTDTSQNYPTSWLWNFGDGSISTVQNPLHSYLGAGTFSVLLTASNSAGSQTNSSSTAIVVTSGVTQAATTIPVTVPTILPAALSTTTPAPAHVTVSPVTTPAATGSSDNSSGLFMVIVVLVIVVIILAISFILRQRPPKGPHRSHGGEL